MNLNLIACSNEIEKAFKSLIKSGRPDITDEDNNTLIPQLYVDLFENDYILRQVLDDNHTLLKGRRGTGKSTIFLRAEHEIQKNKSYFAIYINLQACYEEVRSANSEDENDALTKYLTYKNFLTEILKSIKKRLTTKIQKDPEFEYLFKAIEEGKYIDRDFQRSIEITSSSINEGKQAIDAEIGLNKLSAKGNLTSTLKSDVKYSTKLNELRIFSIHEILKKIKEICNNYGITRIYLFLDDFSELSRESQQVVVDSLISPIISSYNDTFKVKLAGYPSRIYTGNIDSTKIPALSLDFFDAYEQSSSNYNEVEDLAIDYVKRTLEKRLQIFTNYQISIEDIFDLEKASIDEYLRRLFFSTSGIPRSLGFVLNYCYLSSINNGKPITLEKIDAASAKYFEENILADFINDARFKQSFYDDKELLDQIAQKNLMDKIVEKLFGIKRDVVESYQKGTLKKQLFSETLEQYRKGPTYWFPTSHFYISKDIEKLLKTLELYFIVSKFNEGSSREPGKKISYFGLNYGLCILKKIDYGRPLFRRTYDYWRQDEFNLTDFIPSVISSIEIIACGNCGKEYDEMEYTIYQKFHKCFKCGSDNTVEIINKFESKLKSKLEEWHKKKLPDKHIEILRTLYNNHDYEMSAHDIGTQIDRHHLSITHAMRFLVSKQYVTFDERDKRYYKITDYAIARFFSDSLEEINLD